MASDVSSIDLVKGWISAFESGNRNYLQEHTTEDMVISGAAPQALGWQQFLEMYPHIRTAFPDLRMNASDFKQVSDRVTCSVRITGTHSGVLNFPLMSIYGFQPTGKSVRLPVEQNTFLIRDGKIARLEIQKVEGGGIPGMLAQIGASATQPIKPRSTQE